jgi:putative hemolysin
MKLRIRYRTDQDQSDSYMEDIEKIIDIEKAIKEGNNRFLKSLPRFIIRIMKKIVCEDEINFTIHRSRHLTGVPFIIDVLKAWDVTVKIEGEDNIPQSGKFIFAANHPVGGIDALSIYSIIYSHFTDVVSPANELLNIIPNLRPLVLGLNVFGKSTKEIARGIDSLFESSAQIMIFPAGEVSRRRRGKISDITWQKSFITKAIQHKRDIIPVHLSGRNSNLFYNVASLRQTLGIKMYVESLLLPREMIRQRGSATTVTIGKVIPCQSFTKEHKPAEWAQKVKEIVYSLPDKEH